MRAIESLEQMQSVCRDVRRSGKRLGLVPTMGALHEGHLSLVRAARAQCDVVAVSLFVNPLQFGPKEDYSKYPRTFERDRALLEAERVDLLLAPSAQAMYPPGASTFVEVAGLSDKLDGKSRPGHFRGVATVVAKLFHIVQPDLAFFGQKDAAQLAIIRRMVRDQNMDVQIVPCPIVREPDGLAMSSRNQYLSGDERKRATVLYRSLCQVRSLFDRGEQQSEPLIECGKRTIAEEPAARLDYFAIVDPDTLDPVNEVSRGALVAVAAWVGSTRLIDNIFLPG
ncbi:MAG TPA: pantoate--beta-alanine ligase [Terriglobales bacterium]|nr:pantoate--beta-alanine ligase [Terriglobales bacterium]